MSKQYTNDEERRMFLDHIAGLVDYWDRTDRDSKGKLSGLAHSFCALLDGCTWLPSYAVVPCPHPDDKAYHEERGEHFHAPTPSEVDAYFDENSISGTLHESIYDHLGR